MIEQLVSLSTMSGFPIVDGEMNFIAYIGKSELGMALDAYKQTYSIIGFFTCKFEKDEVPTLIRKENTLDFTTWLDDIP